MKFTTYPLLAGLLLLGACGGSDAPKDTKADDAAVEAAAKLPTMSLDLTQYGAPVTLTVPQGTTAMKDTAKTATGDPRVLINGPQLAIMAETQEESESDAKFSIDMSRKMDSTMKAKIEVAEPLAVLSSSDMLGVSWRSSVVCPNNKVVSFEISDPARQMSEAAQRNMFKVARTAKPTGK